MDSLPEKVRLPFLFDVRELENSLQTLEKEYWVGHFVKQNYQGDWSVLPLTAQKGREHPILMASSIPGGGDYVETSYLSKTPYFKSVLTSFDTKPLSIRLMRLGPKSEIKEHRDYDLDENEVRLHIPILTNSGVHFYLNKKEVAMKAGECWYLRLSDPHQVINDSDQARVHLVMDLELNEWLRKFLTQNSATP